MLVTKRMGGEVEYNDGEFAEVMTYGVEGIEKDLLLAPLQIQRQDTDDTNEEFKRRFPVGIVLDIVTSTEITFKGLYLVRGTGRSSTPWTIG